MRGEASAPEGRDELSAQPHARIRSADTKSVRTNKNYQKAAPSGTGHHRLQTVLAEKREGGSLPINDRPRRVRLFSIIAVPH